MVLLPFWINGPAISILLLGHSGTRYLLECNIVLAHAIMMTGGERKFTGQIYFDQALRL